MHPPWYLVPLTFNSEYEHISFDESLTIFFNSVCMTPFQIDWSVKVGRLVGLDDGCDDGCDDGRDNGWDDGCDVGAVGANIKQIVIYK